ncbi:hypothetical protein P8452_42686 [Trifolium repens]|nr:hypothetical protein P8452_42686 [Trifolium repens]
MILCRSWYSGVSCWLWLCLCFDDAADVIRCILVDLFFVAMKDEVHIGLLARWKFSREFARGVRRRPSFFAESNEVLTRELAYPVVDCSSNEDSRLIVYELMQNGSLETQLLDGFGEKGKQAHGDEVLLQTD